MKKLSSRLLRVALLMLAVASVFVQIVVPAYASEVGVRFPEVADLVIPYSAAAILFIGCAQVALLAIWRLLSLVDRAVIFTDRAVRWIDVIVGCGVMATILIIAILIHMLGFVPGGGGPMVYYLVGGIAGSVALVLLMVVMRGLLLSAIADRAELDAVI